MTSSPRSAGNPREHPPSTEGHRHLLAELARLDLMLQRQVLRLRAQHQLIESDYRGMYIPDEQIDALLRENRPGDGQLASIESLTAQIVALEEANRERRDNNHPLARLARLFGLDAIEEEILLIALAPAVDLRYETLYAYVQNDIAKKQPTLDLALKLMRADPLERLDSIAYGDPAGPLFRHHLVEMVPDPQDVAPSPLANYLKIDPHIASYALDQRSLDARLRSFVTEVRPSVTLDELPLPKPSLSALDRATGQLAQRPGLIFLAGPYGAGKEAIAQSVAQALDLRLLKIDLRTALSVSHPFEQLLVLLGREARLADALIYLEHTEVLDGQVGHADALMNALDDWDWPVVAGGVKTWRPAEKWPGLPFHRFQIPLPDFQRRRRLWELSLGPHSLGEAIDLEAISGKFNLTPGQIADAAGYASALAALRPAGKTAITTEDLARAARARSNQALRELAQKVMPRYGWEDIVLPRHSRQQLREVYLSIKHRHRVYEEWGFERKLALGKGVNALFFGPSGTGKTMAADILARELDLDLYKIDLSTVVSKYIGETEKNLSRIFNAAQASNAILLFDEADALFGKRSEVKDARDRYANIEVAYLLQKMEEYDGITILATNMRSNMDDAFVRRLHHAVEFPFPDARLRERIWRNLFPAETPLSEDLDFHFMADQFELAGGNIRNVALTGAFLAAEAGSPVQMEHLILGVGRELQKLGRLPDKTEFGAYYPLVRHG